MCGRYTLADVERIQAEFAYQKSLFPELSPRYNLSPTQTVPLIVEREGERALVGFRWGLLSPWSEGPNDGYKTINARIEGLTDPVKPTKTYLPAMKANRRCILPADGFYEWLKVNPTGKAKDVQRWPHLFRFKDRRTFGMPGLWQNWKSPEGKWITTCTLITAKPINIVKKVHDRSPVILTPDLYDDWLNPEISTADIIGKLCPWEREEEMEDVPVSQEVNSSENEGPHLIHPLMA